MAFAVFRLEKLKSCNAGVGRQKHNTRTTEKDINTLTTEPKIKTIKIGDMRGREDMTFTDFFKKRTEGQHIRSNATYGFEIIQTFSPGAIRNEELKSWAEASMKWISQSFGGSQNIYSAQLHMDETTPHLHCIVVPIDSKGKLNAKAFTGEREQMRQLQTTYADAVKDFGLQRGIDKKITKKRHRSHLDWIRDNSNKEGRLEAYEKVFGTEEDWSFDDNIKFKGAQAEIENNKLQQSAALSQNLDLCH